MHLAGSYIYVMEIENNSFKLAINFVTDYFEFDLNFYYICTFQ